MAPPSNFQIDIEKRISVIEERVRPKYQGILSAVLVVVVGAILTGAGWWGSYITTNLIAIKQQLADGGNKQIVAELKAPKSLEQLQANLSTVVAQVQTARVEKRKPDLQKVAELSGAVGQVVQQHSDYPQAWQAAGELITYRTNLESRDNSKTCTIQGQSAMLASAEVFTANPGLPIALGLIISNCTIVLDDAPQITETDAFKVFQKNFGARIRFENVHVIYRGGAIIPVKTLAFVDCTFEFQLDSNKAGRKKVDGVTLVSREF